MLQLLLQTMVQTYWFHAIIGALLFTIIVGLGQKEGEGIGLLCISPILGLITSGSVAFILSEITGVPPSWDITGIIIPLTVTAFIAVLLGFGMDASLEEEETKKPFKA